MSGVMENLEQAAEPSHRAGGQSDGDPEPGVRQESPGTHRSGGAEQSREAADAKPAKADGADRAKACEARLAVARRDRAVVPCHYPAQRRNPISGRGQHERQR